MISTQTIQSPWDGQILQELSDSTITRPIPSATTLVIGKTTETKHAIIARSWAQARISKPQVSCIIQSATDTWDARYGSGHSTHESGQKQRLRSIINTVSKRRQQSNASGTPRQKRVVRFDSSQQHRHEAEYRKQDEFDRRSSVYAPGIHADVSGVGHEDTSGCSIPDDLDAELDNCLTSQDDPRETAIRLRIELLSTPELEVESKSWLSERMEELRLQGAKLNAALNKATQTFYSEHSRAGHQLPPEGIVESKLHSMSQGLEGFWHSNALLIPALPYPTWKKPYQTVTARSGSIRWRQVGKTLRRSAAIGARIATFFITFLCIAILVRWFIRIYTHYRTTAFPAKLRDVEHGEL